MTHNPPLPSVKMRVNKSPQRIKFGFPWVFSDELVLDRRTRTIPAGSLISLLANDGAALGVCTFNAESRIVCRVLDQDPEAIIDVDWFKRRIAAALALRTQIYERPFYRLIHAEADGLPGVIVDRFGDTAVLQPNAAWADRMTDDIVAALIAVTGIGCVVNNGTGRARKLEGLADNHSIPVGQIDGPLSVQMNGATYFADVLTGQKTGLFLDQRDNHAFAARLAKNGDMLDVFSHVGGFSLAALANGAKHATAIDASKAALDLAAKGAEASGFQDRFSTLQGDAFDVMRDLAAENRTFDSVICDPPAFAPHRKALEAGLRAYEKVARHATQLVKPGGYLGLCSCSHAVDAEAFRAASLRGIGKAGRTPRLLYSGTAGPDHPMHPSLAESGYLKALFFRLS